MSTSADIRKLTREAKARYAAMNEAEASVYRNVNLSNYYAWLFGKFLHRAKDTLGHGSFSVWRSETFPRLHERKAQRCQELYARNSNATELTDLSERALEKFISTLSDDSVRKYRLGYIPEKDRPQQKGDKKFGRPTHYSSVLGECNKLQQRIEAGQSRDDREEMRCEFAPFFTWLYGSAPYTG
jgi:hypothetical protein